MSASPAEQGLLRRIAELLREVVGEDRAWLDAVGPDTRIDGELLLESHELAAWNLALRREYGDGVDLVAHVAGLDIDQIIALTVADVAAHVAARRSDGPAVGATGPVAPSTPGPATGPVAPGESGTPVMLAADGS
ncbi:acyl carrier protein [Kitasatospora sp. NPDC057015]|uniref:acyl carrier protein n=1 Tax=Kitasatospora sp. NPDC057015 TaxID=3346001 RepID=UPI00362D99A2